MEATAVLPFDYFRRIWKLRYFWLSIVNNDLHNRYRRSFLGIGWSLARPLGMTAVFCLIFGNLFGIPIEEYAPFVLVGLTSWQFFTETILMGCHTFRAGAAYIRQQRSAPWRSSHCGRRWARRFIPALPWCSASASPGTSRASATCRFCGRSCPASCCCSSWAGAWRSWRDWRTRIFRTRATSSSWPCRFLVLPDAGHLSSGQPAGPFALRLGRGLQPVLVDAGADSSADALRRDPAAVQRAGGGRVLRAS